MVPGDRGAEEGGVKVNLLKKKKHPVGSKRARAGTFMFAKKLHQKYTNMHHIYSQSASVIYCFGLQVKPKFQIVTFFPDINHGKGSIGGTFTANVSLVPPV